MLQVSKRLRLPLAHAAAHLSRENHVCMYMCKHINI